MSRIIQKLRYLYRTCSESFQTVSGIGFTIVTLFVFVLPIQDWCLSVLPVMLQACIDQGKTIEETKNILISSCSYDGQNIITGLFAASRQIEPLYDAQCTTVLRQLTQMNLLQKEDVQQYALLNKLLQGSCPANGRSKATFRFFGPTRSLCIDNSIRSGWTSTDK